MFGPEFRRTQGDVTLYPLEALPEGLKLVEDKVVQPSETHGKFHRFAPDADVQVYDRGVMTSLADGEESITPDTEKFVVVGPNGAVLFHGTQFDIKPSTETNTDHSAVVISPGIYKVNIASEYNYDRMEEVKVTD